MVYTFELHCQDPFLFTQISIFFIQLFVLVSENACVCVGFAIVAGATTPFDVRWGKILRIKYNLIKQNTDKIFGVVLHVNRIASIALELPMCQLDSVILFFSLHFLFSHRLFFLFGCWSIFIFFDCQFFFSKIVYYFHVSERICSFLYNNNPIAIIEKKIWWINIVLRLFCKINNYGQSGFYLIHAMFVCCIYLSLSLCHSVYLWCAVVQWRFDTHYPHTNTHTHTAPIDGRLIRSPIDYYKLCDIQKPFWTHQ